MTKQTGDDLNSGIEYRISEYGGLAQLGEHLPCKQGVSGSNPLISTILIRKTRSLKTKQQEEEKISKGSKR